MVERFLTLDLCCRERFEPVGCVRVLSSHQSEVGCVRDGHAVEIADSDEGLMPHGDATWLAVTSAGLAVLGSVDVNAHVP